MSPRFFAGVGRRRAVDGLPEPAIGLPDWDIRLPESPEPLPDLACRLLELGFLPAGLGSGAAGVA